MKIGDIEFDHKVDDNYRLQVYSRYEIDAEPYGHDIDGNRGTTRYLYTSNQMKITHEGRDLTRDVKHLAPDIFDEIESEINRKIEEANE